MINNVIYTNFKVKKSKDSGDISCHLLHYNAFSSSNMTRSSIGVLLALYLLKKQQKLHYPLSPGSTAAAGFTPATISFTPSSVGGNGLPSMTTTSSFPSTGTGDVSTFDHQ